MRSRLMLICLILFTCSLNAHGTEKKKANDFKVRHVDQTDYGISPCMTRSEKIWYMQNKAFQLRHPNIHDAPRIVIKK